MRGYEALREAAAWLDLSARGRIRATGEDRVRLLHAMTTNHIQQLAPGEGCYTFFLNAQGRILADAVILALDDALLIDTEAETRGLVFAHLDKYIIADDVTLEDITDDTVEIGVEGPASRGVVEGLKRQGERTVVPLSTTGQPGFSIVAPAGAREALIRDVEAAGAAPADAEAVRVVRLERGHPRYGEDITDRHIPHETQVLAAVHFNKGCYLGQEVVERVRSRGGVHRVLVPLSVEGEQAPAAGSKIHTGGREVGEITTAAYSPAFGRVAALAYVRPNDIPVGAELTVAGRAARITGVESGS
jgi:folate-binding protein YgfZ